MLSDLADFVSSRGRMKLIGNEKRSMAHNGFIMVPCFFLRALEDSNSRPFGP